MSTNVRTVNTIKSFWNPINVEAHTAVVSPSHYFVLTIPDVSKSIMIEEKEVESEEKIQQLFSEFAEEDIEMAEMGMAEYNEILLTEDVE